jgi:outer membrane lipoprotein-sorting protein
MKTVSIFCFLLLLGTGLAHSRQGVELSPQEILDRMVSVYASCSSYEDAGKVETHIFGQRVDSTQSKPFSTLFVRPSQFRFEFKEERLDGSTTRYIVWQDGPVIKSWWTIRPETRTFETLNMALAGAAGVSGGSAVNVPSMLMGDLHDSHRIQTLTQLSLKGEEMVGGRTAYRIEGRDWRHNLLTIWIDKERFLLLKMNEKRELNNAEAETTTTYQPRINIEIAPDKFAFNH